MPIPKTRTGFKGYMLKSVQSNHISDYFVRKKEFYDDINNI